MKRAYLFLACLLVLGVNAWGQSATGVNIGRGPGGDADFWAWRSPTNKGVGLRWMDQVELLLSSEIPLTTGKIWYVDSGVVVEGNGANWDNAYNTLQEAIDAADADGGDNRGDIIKVAQGHTENIASAAAVTVDVVGVTIEGCSTGDDMPEFALTAEASTFAVSVADVTIKNVRFLGNFTNGVTQCLDIGATGDGCRVIGCEFKETSSTKELLIMITLTADADRCLIYGNRFLGESGGTDSVAINLEGGSDKTVIAGNAFIGDWSGYVVDGTTAASTEIIVASNYVHNADTSAGKTMAFHASTTGGAFANECYGNGATYAFVGDAMYVSPTNVFLTVENVETAVTYYDILTAILTDTAALDTSAELRTLLFGSDTAGATAAALTTVDDFLDTEVAQIMGDTDKITDATLGASPTAGSLATFIANGSGAALGTALAAGKSLVDAVGTNGTTVADTATGLAGMIGVNDSDNVMDSSSVASNRDGSVLERLEFIGKYFETGTPGALVAPASTFSLLDILGSDGSTTTGAVAGSLLGATGTNEAASATAFSSSAVEEDADGSVLEREEALRNQASDALAAMGMGEIASGGVYYVDSVAGNDTTGSGVSWALAEATLAAAIGDVTTDKGATIFVATNHAETIGASVAINKANIRIIGLGVGESRPVFTFTATGSAFTHTVPDVMYKNLIFLSSTADKTVGISLDASSDGAVLEDCEFRSTGAFEFISTITFAAATDKVRITRCKFFNNTVGVSHATAAITNIAGVTDGMTVENCYFDGAWTVGAISDDDADTNVSIMDNIVQNSSTGIAAITYTAAATGTLARNLLYTDAYATSLDPGSLKCFENYYVDVIDEGSYPVPARGDNTANYLGTNSSNNDATTASVLANGDGSVVERQEFLQSRSDAILAALRMAGTGIGSVFYVDSGAGNSANNGTTWALAEDTLTNGIGDATANKGDIIFVSPGHAETLGEAQITVNKNGVRIIGLGEGLDRPQIDFQHANSSIDVTGSGVRITGLDFYSSTAATAIGLHITGSDCVVEDCLFSDVGDFEFAICITLGADAERTTIRNNRFLSVTGTTGATACIDLNTGVVDRCEITGNHIAGDFSTAAISSSQINTNMLIKDNAIDQANSGDWCIELTGAATGLCVNNLLYADAYATTLDPGSLKCIGNLAVDAIDEAGYPIPAVGDRTDNYLGTNSADNDATTAAVVANGNGSIVERLEAVQVATDPYFGHPNYLAVSATFDATTGDAHWGNSGESDEIVTVTGACRIRILMECTASLTDGGDTATLSLLCGAGVVIAATTCATVGADATQIATGEIWVDTSPAEIPGVLTSAAFIDIVSTGGTDIGVTTAGEDITGGTIIFHVWWTPLDSTGLCAAGTGQAL